MYLPVMAALAIFSIGVIGFKENERRVTVERTQFCIDRMFTDPDAFDPSAHFEINAESAPPFQAAADWVNENLVDCLDNYDSWKGVNDVRNLSREKVSKEGD